MSELEIINARIELERTSATAALARTRAAQAEEAAALAKERAANAEKSSTLRFMGAAVKPRRPYALPGRVDIHQKAH